MRQREILKRIEAAREKVSEEIRGVSSGGGKYARGLASEGYAGGYRDCLNDVALLFADVQPSRRNYWERTK